MSIAITHWAAALTDCHGADTPARAQRTPRLVHLRGLLAAHADALVGPPAEPLRHRLFELLAQYDDLPILIWLGQAMQLAGEASVEESITLASALWRMGRVEPATDQCRHLLLAHPHCARAADLHAELSRAHRRTCPFPPWEAALAQDGELRLVALGPSHARDFAWQYGDPAIARTCRLPSFESDAHWLAWLDGVQAHGDQVLFALVHEDCGFIGSVSLVLHQRVGFFYFWLGKDFQGLGLGPKAGKLLIDLARRAWDMKSCYAKVLAHNTASRRALEKIGFALQALPIDNGDDTTHLYRWAIDSALATEVAIEARSLFRAMGSRTRVLYPLPTRHADIGETKWSMREWPRTSVNPGHRVQHAKTLGQPGHVNG